MITIRARDKNLKIISHKLIQIQIINGIKVLPSRKDFQKNFESKIGSYPKYRRELHLKDIKTHH